MHTYRLSIFYCFLISVIGVSARDFVHVITSKGVYETSEDLWFKCLIIDEKTCRLSEASHTAYIELVAPNDSVVSQDKYPITQGQCDGHIYVGEDWIPGEYRLYAYTRNSVGDNDTILYPHRLLVVKELPEVPAIAAQHKPETVSAEQLSEYSGGLHVSVVLDSSEYHKRSKVTARIRVSDKAGNPVQATIAMSIYDCLYRYKPSEVLLSARNYVDDKSIPGRSLQPFLSDGVSSGVVRTGRKEKDPASGQWLNVYDVDATAGKFNLVETDIEGRFEVSSETGRMLGRELVMKPLISDKKPVIIFDRPFDALSGLRAKATDRMLPIIQSRNKDDDEKTTEDYLHRRTVHLDEVEVRGKTPYYVRRDKLYGYLDSIHTLKSGVWVCCLGHSHFGVGFINDYIKGYTHHPQGYGMPDTIYAPKKGETYEAIKYTGPTQNDYVVDIRHVVYEGDNLSQEELLKEAGLFADQGYSRPYGFQQWDPNDWFVGIEDIRNTLLWAPQMVTNQSGILDLVFYTSDIASSFIIKGCAFNQTGLFADLDNFVFEVK